MKNFWIVFLGLFIATSGYSQEKMPMKVIGTPYGQYLNLQDTSGMNGYKVWRKDNKGKYQIIGSYYPVISASDLQRRMKGFSGVFPNYQVPKRAFIDTVWNRVQKDKQLLIQEKFPLLQLSFGINFIDTSAVLGQTYQYKVIFSNTQNVLESEKTKYKLYRPNFSKMSLADVKNVGTQVRLEWAVSLDDPPPFFELYRKQAAGKSSFKKIGAEKGMFTTESGDSIVFLAVDTTGIEGISYDYFLASVDYLGNEGNHSDTVRLQLGGRQNVPAIYNFRTRSDSNGIRLSWRELSPNPSLRNILVLRSESYDTGYTVLTTLPVRETYFIDRDVAGGKLYYYQLIVEGSANYSIPTPRVSGKFMGKVALNAPYDLQSRSVDDGVSLTWKYKDTGRVKGFKVYRSFHPRQGFEFIGEMVRSPSDTSLIQFTDTTLADAKTTYYYAVAAVSYTSNLGPSSTVVSGSALETSAIPAPTSLRSLWLNDTVVSVTWTNMELQVPEVGGYKIYKNNEELASISNQYLFDSVSINEFTDTLSPGEVNWYWVKAEGAKGRLGSVSSPIRVQAPIDKPLPPGGISLYKQDKSVVLSWNNALNSEINKYNIYRATQTGEPSLIGSVAADKDILHFEDDKVKKGELYFYYVTSINNDKIESNQSEEVHMRIKN